MPDERTFIPTYAWPHRLGLGIVLLAAVSLGVLAVGGRREPGLVALAVILGVVAVLIPFVHVRRIHLGSRIRVDRYLLPARFVEYAEVRDIGISSIQTARGKIALYGMQNADDLFGLLDRAIERGALSESQLAGELAWREAVAWEAASYAFLPSLALAGVILKFAPFSLPLDARWRMVIYFTPTYFAVYWVAKAIVMRRER